MSIYEQKVVNLYGDEVDLTEFEGKVMMIFNSATQCGFTPQYDEIQDLYEKYADQGLAVLEFPCDQFGHQAPGTDEEIATFCDARFGLTFSRYSKVDVNGENVLPLFKILTEAQGFEGFDADNPASEMLDNMLAKADPDYKNNPSIKWNFTKFLVDRDGNVVRRFEPTAPIDKIEEAIEELL
ncbi:MAG: glutathione peroxidase [Lachnospiraceae bacterium]|nr:glutathione peroxidase [Lachnospiraceae bacterium]